MPYNDARSDIFSNPPELKSFESLPPQVVQRLHTIKHAVENIASLEQIYTENVEKNTPTNTNPIIEQIKQNVDISTVRNSIDNAYAEAA